MTNEIQKQVEEFKQTFTTTDGWVLDAVEEPIEARHVTDWLTQALTTAEQRGYERGVEEERERMTKRLLSYEKNVGDVHWGHDWGDTGYHAASVQYGINYVVEEVLIALTPPNTKDSV